MDTVSVVQTATVELLPSVGVEFIAFSFVLVTVSMAVLYGIWLVVSYLGGIGS